MSRPSHVQVDLQALINNYQWACKLAPNSSTMAIIKANAYGHGALACARTLAPLAPAFGVACIEEALKLREAGISQPILLLEGQFSTDEVAEAAQQDFWLMLEDPWQVESVISASISKPVVAWVKMDTGMHRLGLSTQRLPSLLKQLQESPNVAPDIVIASHFACADELDNDFTKQQIASFRKHFPGADLPTSLANSAGILAWPESHGHWNRAGYMLYGNTPLDGEHPNNDGLTPVMSLWSAVISLRNIEPGEGVGYAQAWHATRPTKVATIAIGYADGYSRHTPINTSVLINGQPAPIIGRVSMDMITVDATDLDHVEIGSPVCLWGKDLTVNQIAKQTGTIGYELITRLGQRLPRVYI